MNGKKKNPKQNYYYYQNPKNQKNRKKKIISASEEYIEAVKKTRQYWTEKGNLEKALMYKELQDKLEESLKKRKASKT